MGPTYVGPTFVLVPYGHDGLSVWEEELCVQDELGVNEGWGAGINVGGGCGGGMYREFGLVRRGKSGY